MTSLHVAAAQYPVEPAQSWDGYAEKVSRWVAEAAGAGANLLVFPEYGAMDLVGLVVAEVGLDIRAQTTAIQRYWQPFVELHRGLARQHSVYILAGSFPVEAGGVTRNRAELFSPSGRAGGQTKLIVTRWETEHWGLQPGHVRRVFDTDFGRLGILVCYDAEFPLLARGLVEAGAHLLLVPSATDSLASHHRVHVGARARALENQCYVVTAPLLGTSDWCPAVDVNLGAAGFFTPIDRGFPDDGILAQGELNQPGWVHATLDFAAIPNGRAEGDVLNDADWPRQHPLFQDEVEVVRL